MRFFLELASRQDREWFKEHKADYVALAEQPMKELIEALKPALTRQYKKFKLAPPKQFRIHRDVRFSKDKSPYKTHVAAMIGFEGGMEAGAPAAIYLHLGLDDFAGCGHWHTTPERLARLRKLIGDDKTGRELQKRVDALVKKGFQIESMETTKRVPPGFPADHPDSELLKLRHLTFGHRLADADVMSPRLVDVVAESFAVAAPVMRYLSRLGD